MPIYFLYASVVGLLAPIDSYNEPPSAYSGTPSNSYLGREVPPPLPPVLLTPSEFSNPFFFYVFFLAEIFFFFFPVRSSHGGLPPRQLALSFPGGLHQVLTQTPFPLSFGSTHPGISPPNKFSSPLAFWLRESEVLFYITFSYYYNPSWLFAVPIMLFCLFSLACKTSESFFTSVSLFVDSVSFLLFADRSATLATSARFPLKSPSQGPLQAVVIKVR